MLRQDAAYRIHRIGHPLSRPRRRHLLSVMHPKPHDIFTATNPHFIVFILSIFLLEIYIYVETRSGIGDKTHPAPFPGPSDTTCCHTTQNLTTVWAATMPLPFHSILKSHVGDINAHSKSGIGQKEGTAPFPCPSYATGCHTPLNVTTILQQPSYVFFIILFSLFLLEI